MMDVLPDPISNITWAHSNYGFYVDRFTMYIVAVLSGLIGSVSTALIIKYKARLKRVLEKAA